MFTFFLASFLVLGYPVLAAAPSTSSTGSCGGACVRGNFTLALMAMRGFGASVVLMADVCCIFCSFSVPCFIRLAFVRLVFFALAVFFLLVLRR